MAISGSGSWQRVFNNQLSELNTSVRLAFKNKPQTPSFFKKEDLNAVYNRDGGDCRVCGMSLAVARTGKSGQRPYFKLARAIKNAGDISRDNLILVCHKHKVEHPPKAKFFRRIPEVNTLPDLIERLMVETWKAEKFRENGDLEEAEGCEEVKVLLKRELDIAFQEMISCFYYRSPKRSDYKRLIIEGKTTLSQALSTLSENIIENNDITEALSDVQETLQVAADEQKYEILRPDTDDYKN